MRKLGWAGPVGLLLSVAGGFVYAVTRELGVVALFLIWVGLLLLFLYLYLNFQDLVRLVSKRSTRYGANTAVMILIFLVIIGVVSAMSVKYKWRVDLTKNKRYTLSPQTIKILRSLDRDVEAIAFYRSDERTRQAMFDLLKEYSYYSPRFKFWFIDPDKRPAEAARYGVTSYRTTLIRSGGRQEIVGFESEEKVTNALIRVLSDKQKVIYFTKGHGENSIEGLEKSGYRAAKDSMERENYKVKELFLMGTEQVPKDASLVVISGPKKDFVESEIEKLKRYVETGGRLLVMLDPATLPALEGYLEGYGLQIGDNIIVDKLGQIFGTNYLTPVVTDYNKEHPLTKDFNLATFFPVARTVEIKDEPTKGNYTLARTGPSSWAVTDMSALEADRIEFRPGKDRKGPLGIAAVSVLKIEKKDKKGEELKKWAKVFVVGDSDFANNTNINLAGNRDFFLNIINWLNEETSMISIRKKEADISPLVLTVTQGRLVFWLSVVIAPSVVVVIGIAVLMRRRLKS